MVGIGIDSGSTTTKGIVYDGQTIIKKVMMPTGPNPKRTIKEVYSHLTQGREDDFYCVSTGYGRKLLSEAHKQVTEITCHGRGASFLCPQASGVIDIGGQDSKAISLGSDMFVRDFLMNDKCAAGTGRFLEMLARILHEDLADLDQIVAGGQSLKISSMCTVFAESEVISLLAENQKSSDIAMGVVESICERTSHFAGRLTLGDTIFFSGGLSQFACIKAGLSRHMGKTIETHDLGQYVGAIGAAVIAYDKVK